MRLCVLKSIINRINIKPILCELILRQDEKHSKIMSCRKQRKFLTLSLVKPVSVFVTTDNPSQWQSIEGTFRRPDMGLRVSPVTLLKPPWTFLSVVLTWSVCGSMMTLSPSWPSPPTEVSLYTNIHPTISSSHTNLFSVSTFSRIQTILVLQNKAMAGKMSKTPWSQLLSWPGHLACAFFPYYCCFTVQTGKFSDTFRHTHSEMG